MRDVSCALLSTSYIKDSIGVSKPVVNEIVIPVKVESIYSNEFYKANEQGFKPTLRLRTSSLNYNDEEELKYMGTIYTIVRTQDEIDEVILICQRKVKNVKDKGGESS